MKPKINTNPPICIPRDIFMQAAMMRLGSVEAEIEKGYQVLKKYHKTVTVFGSARLTEESPYYHKARELAGKLASHNYAIVTGGGHGIMEAANRGAKEAGGNSIGFNIQLPHEQLLNEYITDSTSFKHFAPRKIALTLFADAYVYFPGGFGTLDEFAEVITLVQTQKMIRSPIILVGSEFWGDLDNFVEKHMLPEGMIAASDRQIYTVIDDVDEIVRHVLANQTYCNHDDETLTPSNSIFYDAGLPVA